MRKIFVVFCAALLSHHYAMANDAQLNNVEWSESIYLYFVDKKANKISDFKVILNSQWNENLTVIYKKGGNFEQKKINNCNELLNINVYSTIPRSDYKYMAVWRLKCAIMDKTYNLKKYKKSYVGFKIKDLIKDISTLNIKSNNAQLSTYFHSLKNIKSIACKKVTQCKIVTNIEKFTLTAEAIGDYNDDNIADIIIKATSGSLSVSSSYHVGFILTKTSPNSKLSVLEIIN